MQGQGPGPNILVFVDSGSRFANMVALDFMSAKTRYSSMQTGDLKGPKPGPLKKLGAGFQGPDPPGPVGV